MSNESNIMGDATSSQPSQPEETTVEEATVEETTAKLSFPVVGIGASAGGLHTLQVFLQNTPHDSGLAYVIVTHLAPDYESHLAELLQGSTQMPVEQVHQDVPIQADHVYVIPPNRNLATIDSHLHLAALEEERRARAPIDHFFRTLAETHEAHAICVVLSGTGSDGSLGLERIKEVGGLTIVQDPAEAEYDSMPQNAIATGQVDLILPVSEIPARIAEYVQRLSRITLLHDDTSLTYAVREKLQKILTQVRVQTGHDFTRYKTATILRRIQHRMQILGIVELNAYLTLLRAQPAEVHALFNDFLITVSNFFRNAEAFEVLEQEIIPKLFLNKAQEDQVRVWVVGCATGEEAYSVAMLLMEYASQLDAPPSLQVFASDLSENALRKAREGFYADVMATDVSAARLQRFFTKEPGGYRVRNALREMVLFAPHNLLKDPPFSRIDLITCRNMLIYIDPKTQREIYELFHYVLRPSGYLFLGSAETLDSTQLFRTVNRKQSIHQRHPLAHRESFSVMPLRSGRDSALPLPASPQRIQQELASRFSMIHDRLLDLYAPPSLLVDSNYNIVHVSAGISRYLFQPPGAPTNSILERVHEELRPELITALYWAFERAQSSISRPITLAASNTEDSTPRQVVLHVWPATESDQSCFALVLFQEHESQAEVDATPNRKPSDRIAEQKGRSSAVYKRLQTTIEEFETSQQELQSSNEEMQSMNEELRSTAEELESSKEELQSINEELSEVNYENKIKVEELSHLSNDLQNLFAATDIAILFLDRDLRITRFTPCTTELFNVQPTDCHRPLSHITHRLGYSHLIDDAENVLHTLVPVEREVSSEDGRGYLMRLRPYCTNENKIDGVVITFVDITERIKNEQKLRISASQLLKVEQPMQEPLAQVLHDGLQQLLYSANMRINRLKDNLAPNLEAESINLLSEVDEILNNAVTLTRRLAVDLTPPLLDKRDLMESLRGLGAQMQQIHGLAVTITAKDLPPISNITLSLLLYQMVGELLFNVVKHAGVDEANLSVSWEGEDLQVSVEDKGKGFNVSLQGKLAEQNNSCGLAHMVNQLSWQGGRLEINSNIGEGTRATIHIPTSAAISGK